MGATSKSDAGAGSVTTVSPARLSISGHRHPCVDGRDQSDPVRGQARGEQRHGQLRPPADLQHVGHHLHQLAVGHDIRAADLDLAAGGVLALGSLGQVLQDVADGDRLSAVA
jgi:hypothetical protein